MNKYIHYYNQNMEMRTIEFSIVFDQWVKESGGKNEVIKIVRSVNRLELDNLPMLFLMFFQHKYNAILPDDDDTIFQVYLYDPDFYIKEMNRLIVDHESRPTSFPNILFLVLVVLAILGLVSFCD